MSAREEVYRRKDKIQRENRYQGKMTEREGEERWREIRGENIAEAITEAEILSL